MMLRRISKESRKSQETGKQISLHPFTLKFSDSKLEREFARSEAEKDYVPTNHWFILLTLFLFFVFGFSFQMSGIWRYGISLMLMLFGQWLVLRVTPICWWASYRCWIHFAMRTTRMILFIRSVPDWITFGENENVFLAMIHRSGISLLLWHGWGYKLLFHQFAFLHGFLTTSTTLFLPPLTCSHISIYQPGAQNWIHFIWERANPVLELQSGHYTQLGEFGSNRCLLFLLMGHGLIAFALPTAITWATEIQSRHQFIEQRNMDQEREESIHLDSYWKEEVVMPSGKIMRRALFRLNTFQL